MSRFISAAVCGWLLLAGVVRAAEEKLVVELTGDGSPRLDPSP